MLPTPSVDEADREAVAMHTDSTTFTVGNNATFLMCLCRRTTNSKIKAFASVEFSVTFPCMYLLSKSTVSCCNHFPLRMGELQLHNIHKIGIRQEL